MTTQLPSREPINRLSAELKAQRVRLAEANVDYDRARLEKNPMAFTVDTRRRNLQQSVNTLQQQLDAAINRYNEELKEYEEALREQEEREKQAKDALYDVQASTAVHYEEPVVDYVPTPSEPEPVVDEPELDFF